VAARRLVVKAFFAELLNEMQLPDLTEHVLETVDTRLAQESLQ
jgi:feS assembly protein sufD